MAQAKTLIVTGALLSLLAPSAVSSTVATGLLPTLKKPPHPPHSAPHSSLEVAGPTGNI